MKLDITHKGIVASFDTVKEEIINFSFLMIAILIGPLYLYGLYWNGTNLSFPAVLNAIVVFNLVFISIFKLKLSLAIKKHILLFILSYGNLYSIYNLGFFGGSQFFLILNIGLLAFYFPKWIAFGISIAIILYDSIIIFLYTNGTIVYHKDPSLLATSKVIWLADFLLTLLTISIAGYALRKTFKAYSQKVKEQIDSHVKLNYTLENLPIPVGVINKDANITQVNTSFVDYFGYEASEIPTFSDWLRKLYPNTKLYDKKIMEGATLITTAFIEQKIAPIEYHNFLTKNNIEKSVEVHYTVIGDTAICAFIDLTERKKQRKLIVETMMQAERKENGRIAQELHDGIGPLLSTAKIYTHTLSQEKDQAKRGEYLERLNYILDSSISEIRNIINNIGPQILQQYGLSRAIQSFIKHIQLVSTIDIKLFSNEVEIKSNLTEFAIYRSLTELINNSIKYASAKSITITMSQTNNEFSLQYYDDGIGFDYEKARIKGFGLENIKNRIENIGGEIRYTTSLGNGVVVDVVIPENT